MHALILCFALAIPSFAQDKKPETPAAEAPAAAEFETLKRPGDGGIELTADYYVAKGKKPGPLVVGLHMEGSSRGEFRKIASEFARFNCSLLAVDLRCGKEHSEVTNETAAAFTTKNGKPATPADAYVDVVEAVKWARELRPDAKIVLLGSSYSAALAIAYAGREPQGCDAVLAFSPSECIEGWRVALDARNIKVPVYVSCGNGPEEKAKASPILNAVDKKLRSSYFPPENLQCPHGAEALVQEDMGARTRVWHGVYMTLKPMLGELAEPAK